MMRLDKYLAERTGMTRSESRKAITKGRISVDGAICRKADAQLDENTAAVALDGTPLAGAYQKFVYIMLNKPEGVVSASRDKKDTTVVDLVAADFPRRELFPAGRLDKTSTGFVLLTDDGALAHDILSPAHHVEKQYVVTLDTPLTEEMCRGFAAGVTLADGETMAPAGVEPLNGNGLTVLVTLRQGVYHQIKRMFGVFGAGVNALHRQSIGGVVLDTALTPEEIRDYMNRYLPDAIAVREVKEAAPRFHARYNALGKTYRYTCHVGAVKPVFDRKYVTLLDYEPNVERMRLAAAYLLGEQDFASFCGNPRMKKSTVRMVDHIGIEQRRDRVIFTFHGTGFLQNMVRILVGTLLEVGRGYWEPDYVQEILLAKDRKRAGPTAPPEGLCLMKVDY